MLAILLILMHFFKFARTPPIEWKWKMLVLLLFIAICNFFSELQRYFKETNLPRLHSRIRFCCHYRIFERINFLPNFLPKLLSRVCRVPFTWSLLESRLKERLLIKQIKTLPQSSQPPVTLSLNCVENLLSISLHM